MAKKEIVIDVDIKGNIVESSANLKKLKQQLKDIPAGTAEWSKVKNDIRDIEDALESAGQSSEDFKGMLENAPGPLGMLGGAIKKVELATKSFGAAFKALGIGLLVSLIGGLVAAFSQTEGSMKKLEPLMIGLEKILGGLVEVMMPVVDMFMDLAMKALPYVTKGIGMVYSAFSGLFTYLKTAGMAAGKIIKGIFTLDFDAIKEGVKDAMSIPGKVVDSYNDSMARFEEGTKKITKTQKKNLDEQNKSREENLAKALKQMEAQDKLDEAQLEKMKAQALALAATEQEKLDIEKAFAKKSYDLKKKDLEDKQKLYPKDSAEYKAYAADLIKLETDYLKQSKEFKDKQTELDKQKLKDDQADELQALKLQLAEKKITQEQYEDAVYEVEKKYAADKKALADIEIKRLDQLTARKKKKASDEREIALTALQNEMNDLDAKNAMLDFDFQEDLNRLAEKRLKVDEAEKLELANTELNEVEKNKIIQKYADQRKAIGLAEVATTKAQFDAKFAIQSAYMDAIAGFGRLIQQMAGENKDLAITGLLIEKAAALASIAVNAKKNFIKDGGIKSPLAWANLAVAGVSAAAVIVSAVKGVSDIKKAGQDASGGSNEAGKAPAAPQPNMGQNYGEGGMINGPLHAQGGVMINAEGGEAVMTRGAVTAFGPLLSAMNQMGGGRSFGMTQNQGASYDQPQLVAPVSSPMIVKTYVVSNELTTEQEKQAKLKSLSTL